MYQQINLYQPIFRRQRHVFSAAAMLKVVGVLVAALFTISLYGTWQVLGLEGEVIMLEGREKAYAAQLARLDPTESIERRQRLEDELKALNQTLLQQQKLIDVLREKPLGSTEGFAAKLAALARRHHEGLWLTRVVLSGRTGRMQLSGVSLRPESIPEYLDRLGREGALKGQRFDSFEIDRPEGSPRVSFSVSSRAVEGWERGATTRAVP